MNHLRILVVEDEIPVALDISSTLEDTGFGLVKHAATVNAALQQLQTSRWDAVVADANLNGLGIERVVEQLHAHRIPFLIVTGYERENLPAVIGSAPLLRKPFSYEQLAQAVKSLCAL